MLCKNFLPTTLLTMSLITLNACPTSNLAAARRLIWRGDDAAAAQADEGGESPQLNASRRGYFGQTTNLKRQILAVNSALVRSQNCVRLFGARAARWRTNRAVVL